MDYKLLLDTAVMAGEILLESGAETWRVEDTMLRMLRMSGLKTADVLALTTGFVVTLDDPAMDSMTVMRSVESRATDLNRIHAVNQLSPRFLRRKYRPGCAVPPGAGYLSCQVGN